MNAFRSAFWAEVLKARRSKALWLTIAGCLLLPLVGGLFMVILKDPEQARALGLISMKSQLVAGSADWPAYFGVLLQATAMAGTILFAFIAAWVFGREFSDHTAKELLALPTRRETIVSAKFFLIALWIFGLTLMIFLVGLGVGAVVGLPGWSSELSRASFWSLMSIASLNYMLLPYVGLFASAGHGYLPPLGWAFFSFVLAQVVSLLGWGDWLPWSVPVLLSGMFGPPGAEQIGLHSYVLSLLAFFAGLLAIFVWWRSADQTH